jgi:hypothetical protein
MPPPVRFKKCPFCDTPPFKSSISHEAPTPERPRLTSIQIQCNDADCPVAPFTSLEASEEPAGETWNAIETYYPSFEPL